MSNPQPGSYTLVSLTEDETRQVRALVGRLGVQGACRHLRMGETTLQTIRDGGRLRKDRAEHLRKMLGT